MKEHYISLIYLQDSIRSTTTEEVGRLFLMVVEKQMNNIFLSSSSHAQLFCDFSKKSCLCTTISTNALHISDISIARCHLPLVVCQYCLKNTASCFAQCHTIQRQYLNVMHIFENNINERKPHCKTKNGTIRMGHSVMSPCFISLFQAFLHNFHQTVSDSCPPLEVQALHDRQNIIVGKRTRRSFS